MGGADGIIHLLTRQPPHALSTLLLLALLVLSVAPAGAAPPPSHEWLGDLAAARARAESEGKPILVDLWADWCTWCKRLDEEVFSTPAFRDYAKGFVLLRVDTEDSGDGTRLMEEFEIESLPTTLIVSHDLVKIGELRGFAPVEPYIQNLELERALYAMLLRTYEDHRAKGGRGRQTVRATDGQAVRGAASQGGGDATAAPDATVQTLADDFHARRDGRRAAELYRELLVRGTVTAEEEAWNRYYLADSLRLARAWSELPAAVAAAREAAQAVDDEELRERVDLLPYHVARDAERCDEARAALERFVAEHPDGIYLDVARSALRRMKNTDACV